MSLHRMSAGAGYQYLLRHTACGDVERDPSTPLTAYYTDAGYPPGRWLGTGLNGLGDDEGLPPGSVVTEQQMAALYSTGRDPITDAPLGRAYPKYKTVTERIASRTAALPPDLDHERQAQAVAQIVKAETERRMPGAVAGFDLTFTAPKSASVLWALGDPKTQAAVLAAHRAAVEQALTFVEEQALFTRIGARSCVQVPTRGMVAAAFDHWDTRTADPNVHTHVVIANKVQGPDGRWRSVDSRALHHSVVAVSEIYDDLFADSLARELPVSWSWRPRGPRRTPAFEVDGVDDELLAEFSTRSLHIDAALQGAVTDFYATRGRGPNRVEVVRLRQHVTRTTRPAKTAHPLTQLLHAWRDRAAALTGRSPEQLTELAISGERRNRAVHKALRSGDISEALVTRMAAETVNSAMSRRSTWTRWNLLAETARTTRGLRMATPADRHALHDRVVQAALASCVSLEPPDLFTVPDAYRRADGSSAFRRPGEEAFTHDRVLDAEQRLLDAHANTSGPTAMEDTARRIATSPQPARHGDAPVRLAKDQVDAVITIATSGRRLDVLVGPAGTGKTTTLRALRATWEATHGRGSVIGLAPSATAAQELAAALNISCENTAKWLHESTGAGAQSRTAILDGLAQRRAEASSHGDFRAVRRIDAATAALRREQVAWTLRPGHLLIIDEASLAGTFALDALTAQATAADAKMLLVGDQQQLSAVDAGGAFGLLAESGAASELRSLWRFRNRWEANATRLLRSGDPGVIDQYADHNRITSGEAEAMLEDAYVGWQNSERSGQSAILLAADSHTVRALNTRAHDDRVTAELVAPDGIPAADGVTVAVGDLVVTRKNDRRIPVPGGHLRNGALWHVTATHTDGSLTLTPVDRVATSTAEARPEVTLPAHYVADNVELGYATTVHRAQGLTVEHAYVLAAPGMTREALYVGMTRGRAGNHMYVSTDAVDPMCDELPDPGSVLNGREVLERILNTDGTELSATQALRRRQDHATSLATLEPIKATLLADADARKWQRVLPSCALSDVQVTQVLASPSAGALFAALRAGEQEGHPMPRVLAQLTVARSLDNPDDPVHDLAAVLHERVTRWLESDAPPVEEARVWGATSTLRPSILATSSADPDDPAFDTIGEIDVLMRSRVEAITLDAIQTRPAWTRPLGEQPDTEPASRQWREAVTVVASYRDVNQITSVAPLGVDRGGDETYRQQRRIAQRASTTALALTRSPTNNVIAR
ncbi:MAG: relaxase domain-containing protein [Actinomycetia bacterium]|nr:relaxase domain-containing protein [Actinomycetes bacterium]